MLPEESTNHPYQDQEKVMKSLTPVGKGNLLGGCGCAQEYRPNPRHTIDTIIERSNRVANQMHALLRALPQEMSREAESALQDLAAAYLNR